jgi:predicted AlkP superfamily pyrophosphatase or phosphodiesterase
VKIHNYLADIVVAEDRSINFTERVKTIVQWFKTDQATLAIFYHHEPDIMGHKLGPNAAEFKEFLRTEINGFFETLYTQLEEAGLLDSTDVIVTSDHGMAQTTGDYMVVYDHVDKSLITRIPYTGPVQIQILPEPYYSDEVYGRLRNAHPNVTFYWKKDIPDRWHYKNHHRIMPIVGVPDNGVSVIDEAYEGYAPRQGEHGYDNVEEDMMPTFIAHGPSFKKGVVFDKIRQIDMYTLVCHLVGMKPAENNGDLREIQKILLVEPTTTATTPEAEWTTAETSESLASSFSFFFLLTLLVLQIILSM